MSPAEVSILDGNTFVVSDRSGDIAATTSDVTGFFSFDTRFLSTWVLTIDGKRLHPLSVDVKHHYEVNFFLTPDRPSHYEDARISVIRCRAVGQSFVEQVTILSHHNEPLDISIRLDAGSDFADIFGVKNLTVPRIGQVDSQVKQDTLHLEYTRVNFHRTAAITADPVDRVDAGGFDWRVHVPAHGSWTVRLYVESIVSATLPPRRLAEKGEQLEQWISQAPRLVTSHEGLADAYHRGLMDLAALQIALPSTKDLPSIAGGLPWFMTLFGRDSLITSLQTLPILPRLAAGTLPVLALSQGTRLDDFRDQEPGKILHEIRYGEAVAFEEQPHTAYYGAADSTPLFLILLDEYERWTGDGDMVRRLEAEARAALKWIDEYGDIVGNGYVWYQRRNTTTGLENQCWKDSWDAISYQDGRIPALPRATCELQGYAYDAKIRAARLARAFWNDPALADRLETEATQLKDRFNREFWVEDGEYYALGLDYEGRQVNALASNMGHLLWSGIVPEIRAKAVAERLLGPKLFSGWGVRTLAEGEGRYNPVGYHVGTVWPFDSAIAALGLRRYGFDTEAATIAVALIDAAGYFDGRLPEAFAGYDRSLTSYPVEYPTACSPQAWSAGTPMLLLRVLLGMEPVCDHLATNPALPEQITRLELHNVPGRWGHRDAFGRRLA